MRAARSAIAAAARETSGVCTKEVMGAPEIKVAGVRGLGGPLTGWCAQGLQKGEMGGGCGGWRRTPWRPRMRPPRRRHDAWTSCGAADCRVLPRRVM
ncbi:hypothetical protein GCM10023082_05060 [Streptomyces tremellae]|uniref:Uncharacterized protein n=1 Tax=Streptomyces tremellae TaxID=1124239 RepID=A0ABP7DTM9_9ACTN